MHVLHSRGVQGLAHCREVDCLPASHARRAGSIRENAHHRRRSRERNAWNSLCENAKSQRLERITGEHGSGFVKGTMAGRATAAQVVVVHRRKIVVDEAVDVDQLDGSSRRVEMRERRAESFASRVDQNGPQALTATERAVAHRVPKAGGTAVRQRQASFEDVFGALLVGRDAGVEITQWPSPHPAG
jgi:hypothetical protein